MLALVIVGGVVAAVVLAIIGKTQADAASESATAPAVGNDAVADMVSTAVPDDNGTDPNIASTAVTEWRKTGITTDPNTWPSGDAIWDICQAIAMAEGYNTNGAAFKLNNPGDISDGGSIYGSEHHDGSNITHFPDAATGWNWLYNKIKNHITGNSKVFPASWTITQFAQKYAANWQNWKRNVGNSLRVDPDSTSFADYVGL